MSGAPFVLPEEYEELRSSVRRLALQRDVSISTVIQAYTLLENRGVLEARPQSGYYVRARLPGDAPEKQIAALIKRHSLRMVVLTRGAAGTVNLNGGTLFVSTLFTGSGTGLGAGFGAG